MHFGGAMFFTDYSMSAPELARVLEERGFESVWAPEHSHIPLSRKTPPNENTPMTGGFSPTDGMFPTCGGAFWRGTSTKSSKAPIPEICRSSNRPNSSWSSILQLLRRSA
jgi:hypothetical protein